MSIGIQITQDTASPALRRLSESLTDRTGLHESIATRADVLTRRHLLRESRSRHTTARRLGARPTGHLGRAAESVTGLGTAEAATVSVTSPGISRVGGDVEIKPVNGNWLTIPIHKLSYGRTVRYFEALSGLRLFRPGAPGAKKKVLSAMVGRGKSKKLVNFFALSKGVTLRQDRTLLPSDTEYLQSGLLGARDYVRALRQAGRQE